MNKIKILFLLVLTALLTFNCTGTKKAETAPEVEETQDTSVIHKENNDSLNF